VRIVPCTLVTGVMTNVCNRLAEARSLRDAALADLSAGAMRHAMHKLDKAVVAFSAPALIPAVLMLTAGGSPVGCAGRCAGRGSNGRALQDRYVSAPTTAALRLTGCVLC
jgi:hypothetical protein